MFTEKSINQLSQRITQLEILKLKNTQFFELFLNNFFSSYTLELDLARNSKLDLQAQSNIHKNSKKFFTFSSFLAF